MIALALVKILLMICDLLVAALLAYVLFNLLGIK